MKIDISNGRSPYDAVIEEIYKRTDYLQNLVVRVKTTNLGEQTVLLYKDSDYYHHYMFDTDWYEGGDVELLGFLPIPDVEVPNNVDDDDFCSRWGKERGLNKWVKT